MHLSTDPVYGVARAAAVRALTPTTIQNDVSYFVAFFLPCIHQHAPAIPACLTVIYGLSGGTLKALPGDWKGSRSLVRETEATPTPCPHEHSSSNHTLWGLHCGCGPWVPVAPCCPPPGQLDALAREAAAANLLRLCRSSSTATPTQAPCSTRAAANAAAAVRVHPHLA